MTGSRNGGSPEFSDGLDWIIMFPTGTKRDVLLDVLREALDETRAQVNENGLELPVPF